MSIDRMEAYENIHYDAEDLSGTDISISNYL